MRLIWNRVKGLGGAPRFGKAVRGALIFFVIFSVTGFFILPPIVKSLLLKKLTETLHREVTIQTLRVNPFMLSVTVRGVEIREPKSQTPFISFDELYLNFQTVSVFRRGPIIQEIRLTKPYMNIVRNEDMTYNFSDIIRLAEQNAGDRNGSNDTSGPVRFSLNNIQVTDAAVDFADGPRHIKHEVRNAVLSVPFISNLPYHADTYVQPAFSATVNGHAVAFTGTTKPFVDSLETNIDVNVKDLDIPYYLAYSPVPMDFRLLSGSFSTQSSISYVQYKDRKPTLSLKGESSLKTVRITDNADAPLVNLPQVDVTIRSSDLMTMNIHFAKIAVQSPVINVALDKSGRLNLLKLIPADQGKQGGRDRRGDGHTEPAATADGKGPAAVIGADEVVLSGGKVIYADVSEGRAFGTSLEDIEAKISNFSTVKDRKTEAGITFRTDTKEGFRVSGIFSVEPLAAEGTAEASRIVLKKYLPYYEKFINFTVRDGELDFRTNYLYQQTEKGPDIRVSDLTATVNALRLRKIDEDRDFLNIPVAAVKNLSADLAKREIVIGDIVTQKGSILAKRYRIGTLLFSTLVKVSEYLEPSARAAPPHMKQPPSEGPWALTVKRLLLDRYTITYDDEMPVDPVVITLEKVTVKGENLSSVRKAKGKLSLNLHMGEKGSADVNGTVTIEPPTANLKVTLRDLPALPFQSYFADRLRVMVTDGRISSRGTVSFAHTEGSGPSATFRGEIALNNVASIDKSSAEDFLKWNSLFLSGVDLSYNPFRAAVDEIALSDFYARVIINSDGTLNLQNVMEQEKRLTEAGAGEDREQLDAAVSAIPAPATAGPAGHTSAGKAGAVTIAKVTLQGGSINFTDKYIKPSYTANLIEIGGRVSGLSSEENSFADVDLKGRLDNYAPLEISGRINPLRDDLFVDLKVDFRDMDLSPITPYSGRYLGYTVEKGKLSLNLQYLIVKKKLDSQNNVFLDQFTLGEQVESPDATKLPVRLAIALLKNRKGEIKLDIPVSGEIDDPKFSMGRIIIKILLNLLVKAATSPFALLGAIFGGGEELSYLEFDYGLVQLNEQGQKKLDTLIKALHDRPALKLEIEGHADPEKDREGLRQYLFNKKVKAQKLKEMLLKGTEAVTIDAVKIDQVEYPKYLKQAYKDEKFPKPRNLIGVAKDLPVPEMEKLMLTHIEVKDDDLRQLASQRAMTVKDYLVRSKQVELERVFLIEPKAISPEKKENIKDSRVIFRLK